MNNSNGLSDTDKQEEAKLYALQKAMMDNDFDKIDELMKPAEQPAETVNPDLPVEPATPDEPVEPINPEEETNAPPATEAGEADPNAPVEPTVPETPEVTAELAAVKEKLDAAMRDLHRYKSDAGRVPALQKRMVELEKRLSESKRNPNSPDDVFTPEDKKVLDDLRENDPVMADHLEKLMKGTTGRLRQQMEERLRQADESEYAQIAQEIEAYEYNRLQSMFPNFDVQTVFRSPEWAEWKSRLRPSDRAYAESSSADEVYAAIQWFGQDLQARKALASPSVPQPTPVAPAATQAAPTPRPAAAPRVKANIAAQPQARQPLNEDEAYSQLWKEIGDRDGLNGPKLR